MARVQGGFSLDSLRRDAKALMAAHAAQAPVAIERLRRHLPESARVHPGHADFLNVIAREQGVESWPRLRLAAEVRTMDRKSCQQRLGQALFQGHGWVTEQLLADMPDLSEDDFGLQCALYDYRGVETALARDPGLAVQTLGSRRPILHLAFSRWIGHRPESGPDMIAVAGLLLAAGADVNDGYAAGPEDGHLLSALYGAMGHADNMQLARWLLEHGADPNDGESLYHATELGHHRGLELLLEHGADPRGTNALLRAMDFDDVAAVRLLLAHGAHPDDSDAAPEGDGQSWIVPALHQAARRGCGAEMVGLLLGHGADPARIYCGASAYSYARVFGNRDLADAIEASGAAVTLRRDERLLAGAADGSAPPATSQIDPETLPEAYANVLRMVVHLPGRLDHVRRLVALGVEFDGTDSEGLTPVQVAGWEGLPEMMAYLLSLGPDLNHVNAYGGTLLSTVLHGSENNPQRDARDHLACLELALRSGVPLPRRMLDVAGREDTAALLDAWAGAHPEQVV